MRAMAGDHPVEGTNGDLMDRKIREHGMCEGLGWMVGSISLLFLLSAGLELFVRQGFRQLSVATFLLVLSLAFWSFVLSLGILLSFSVWWFVKWRRGLAKRAVMGRQFDAGLPNRHLEKSELRDPHSPQRGMALPVSSHTSNASEDGHEARRLSRVA